MPISNGQPGSGGFLAFPGGKFIADPKSNVVVTGVPLPSPGPYGYGYSNYLGLTYDGRYSKWLPVPRQMVTPDETRYVVPSTDSVYVLRVGGGATVELGSGRKQGWSVLDVEAEGVYANPRPTTQQAVAGLWLLPFNGAPRQITKKGYWQLAGRGWAYGYEAPSVPSGAAPRLMRLDLKTGVASSWFDEVPPNMALLGLDLTGRPIAFTQGPAQQVVVLTGSNQTVNVTDGSIPNFYVSWALADSKGIWLASGDGTYLWTGAGAQLEKVSTVSGPLAGPCI